MMIKEWIMNCASSALLAVQNIRRIRLWLIPLGLCLFGQALAQNQMPRSQPSIPLSSNSQPEWNVLYGLADFKDAEKMLPDYLTRALGKIADDREKVIAGLKSVAELEGYRAATAGNHD